MRIFVLFDHYYCPSLTLACQEILCSLKPKYLATLIEIIIIIIQHIYQKAHRFSRALPRLYFAPMCVYVWKREISGQQQHVIVFSAINYN